MRNSFFLTVSVTFFFMLCMSCDQKELNPSTGLKLHDLGKMSITIDQETSHRISARLSSIQDTLYLSFFNPNNYAIYIYNH